MSIVVAILILLTARAAEISRQSDAGEVGRVGRSNNLVLGKDSRPVIALGGGDDGSGGWNGSTSGAGSSGGGAAGGSGSGGGGNGSPGASQTPVGADEPLGAEGDETGDPPAAPPPPVGGSQIPAPLMLHHQSYPRDDGTLFLPATGYTIIYQSDDRQSFESHRIDIGFVLQELRERFDASSDAMVMLDYEFEFVEAMESDPALPRFQDMQQHLCEVLDQIKSEFPSLRLTYYRIPNLPVYPASSGGQVTNWASASDATRDRERRRIEAMSPLLDRMDWFAPNLYDWLSNEEMIDRYGERSVQQEQVWRRDLVRAVVDQVQASSRPDRPVLPLGCSMWVYRSTRSAPYRDRLIPMPEFLSDQVAPAIAAGADGMSFWNNDRNMIQGAFGLAPGIQATAVERYRRALTHRNGGQPFAWGSEIDRMRAYRMLRDQELERLEASRAAFAGD